MRQLDFSPPSPPPHRRTMRGATLEEQFAAFHSANPHVYQALRRLAVQMVRPVTGASASKCFSRFCAGSTP